MPYPLSSKSSFNTASVGHILNACAPTPGTPSSTHAPTYKPHFRWLNWTVTATLGQKPGCPKTSSGGERPSHSHMLCLVWSFPSPLVAQVSRPLWQNSMLTPALPPHTPLLLIEVVHALRLPATVADDVSIDMQLTLNPQTLFYIPLHISYLTAPLFRFFVITYLRTTCFITYSGL